MTEILDRQGASEVVGPVDPCLVIDRLAIDFGGSRPAVESVSLSVGRGEIVALVGESGSGKSMTARAVLGLLPPNAKVSGQIHHDGSNLLDLTDDALNKIRGRRISMVFQEPQASLNPVRSVGWQLVEVLRAHQKISRKDARSRAVELLRLVDIPDPETRVDHYPHELSGGQKQRVVLALALANEPELLLADEPTTALDVTVQREILRLLQRIREDLGTAILIITHNMGVVGEIADRVVVMRAGTVLEDRPTRELFAAPEHPYTRQLLDSVMELPEEGQGPQPAIEESAVTPVLEYRGVEVRFGGGKGAFRAVDGVDLCVAPGEVVGLVGESGSGKTTLGRLAVGLSPLTGGRVLLNGTDLSGASGRRTNELRRGIAMIHQDPASSLDPRWSVGKSIREPLDIAGIGDSRSRDARVVELLDAVRLPADYAERRPHELSGGQRQRIALARALVNNPSLVVADEPTSALDVSVQATVLELFTDLQAELGFACLFISHDLAVVHKVSDRVVVLRAGAVVEAGDVDQVLTRPGHEYTRALVAAVPGVQHLRATPPPSAANPTQEFP